MYASNRSMVGPLVTLFLVLEGVATLFDVLMGPGATMSTEEAYNAAAAAMLACGHDAAIWDLQYKWFCGGCTAEAVMAKPFFALMGPTVFAWKWVPGLIHVAIVSAGAAIAGRAAGARSAYVFVAIMVAAPEAFRTLAYTGFGNHAESPLFPFLAAGVLLAVAKQEQWIQLVAGLVVGVILGLGIWFSPTTLFGLIAVLTLAGWTGRWVLAAVLAGVPFGLMPAFSYFEAQPDAWGNAYLWWARFDFAPPGELVRFLVTDFVTGSLWPNVGPVSSGLWWFSLVVLSVIGMAAVTLRGERPWGARAFVPICIASLLLAYWVRYDLWHDNPAVVGFDPFNLRYRAPLFPLLALSASFTAGALEDTSIFRRGAALGAVILVSVGFVLRLNSWHPGGTPVFKEPAITVDGRVDLSVPEGEPPQRLDRLMGRPEDVGEAMVFLDSHEDALPICRQLHESELGRRVGLALVRDPEMVIVRDALAKGEALEGADREAFIRGLAAALATSENTAVDAVETQLSLIRSMAPSVADGVQWRLRNR